jgi:hypothetical protein
MRARAVGTATRTAQRRAILRLEGEVERRALGSLENEQQRCLEGGSHDGRVTASDVIADGIST